MQTALLPDPWYDNTLFDSVFLEQLIDKLAPAEDFAQWFGARFQPQTFAAGNEAQLEELWVRPCLAQLGWEYVPQFQQTIQGKEVRPDYCLTHPGQAARLMTQPQATELIVALLEAKSWNVALDTGRAGRDNPHHQLQDYLNTLRVRFGFATNGRHWRLYDNQKLSSRKTYLEIDLMALAGQPQELAKGLALFAHLFGHASYVAADNQPTPITKSLQDSARHIEAIEENLKAVIYGFDGEDSLFEEIGLAVHQRHAQADMTALFDHSMVLLFRLLFIIYFEHRHQAVLALHPFRAEMSLLALYERLRAEVDADPSAAARFSGNHRLVALFDLINTGDANIDVPLFNGGLFDPARAPLLALPKLFDNATLCRLLARLIYKTEQGATLFEVRRDYAAMSVLHLGSIYEGLLEFRFERAFKRDCYAVYTALSLRGKRNEGYYDIYDFEVLKKQKGFQLVRRGRELAEGEVHLKSKSNSRKFSASFYTPVSLSSPLVERAIDAALAARGNTGAALLDLRILDNACGSGHFLVEALERLTQIAIERLETDAAIRALAAEEHTKIRAQLQRYNLTYTPDDQQVVKRALLKRCIYGVDVSPFAVELTRLSLWMDSFIFGTPLSFIEHHIQCGNALIGSSLESLLSHLAPQEAAAQTALLPDPIVDKLRGLAALSAKLDNLRDSTAEEVLQSKRIYREEVKPLLDELTPLLDLHCALHFWDDDTLQRHCPQGVRQAHEVLMEQSGTAEQRAELKAAIAACRETWRFLHYELAFPEAFPRVAEGEQLELETHRQGFDIIIGNPPWDKTKLEDTTFFSQYHSRYRSISDSEKANEKARLLSYAAVNAEYTQQGAAIKQANAWYKAHYPLNAGSGDGNLFRFFVERNLGLLAPGGSLNYVVPSALMFEEGSRTLRQEIFTRFHTPFFYSFENRDGLFPEVDSRYKFALTQIINTKPAADAALDAAFYLTQSSQIAARRFAYPLATVKALSPVEWALMEVRAAPDLAIAQKCYARFAPLSEAWLNFRNELHMTADKGIFLEQPGKDSLPLYEGKMIWQFNPRFETPTRWVDQAALKERLHSRELHRMAQDLGLKKADAEAKFAASARYDSEFIRLALRGIASDTNERTLICALLPANCCFGHSLFAESGKTYVFDGQTVNISGVSLLRQCFALGLFNTLLLDWLLRLMVQINVSKTYLYRLPVPQPDDAEIRHHADYWALAKNAARLTLAYEREAFAELMPLFDLSAAEIPTTPKACDLIRAENDRSVCRLYGVTQDELAYLLQSFTVLRTKRPEYLSLLG